MNAGVTLLTERLTLRKLTEADIPALVAGLNDFTVSGWLTVVPYPYTEEDARGFVAHIAGEPDGFDGFAIVAGGTVVGVIGIGDSLGYWLARAAQGRGYASEAAVALVSHYFAATGAERLASGYFEGNHPSCHVLDKLGFVPDGTARVKSRAQAMDMTLEKMILTRTAWEARHGH
ncbi:GNAT family N-acetyltransferase [Sinisalibacter aestuarii]|uniref:N-acetyltransferase n=1 Tax=Sinisalibacter aestuarii TaxID=2949426 RepID=A0ABQ5LSD7_9RHOB|nr:GNAT family protein [Sinisalibacter aestuarii]GKY87919.1 N-acetyltransferase [Sinisalibacter aestuarii]